MKKYLRYIPFAIAIIVLFYAITIVLNRNADYKTPIETSIENFYITNNEEDLKDIKDLLDRFKNDKSIVKTINNYTYKILGEKMLFIEQLYVCDVTNNLDCNRELEEYEKLQQRINVIHEQKSKKDLILLNDNDYENLNNEINKKIIYLTNIKKEE